MTKGVAVDFIGPPGVYGTVVLSRLEIDRVGETLPDLLDAKLANLRTALLDQIAKRQAEEWA